MKTLHIHTGTPMAALAACLLGAGLQTPIFGSGESAGLRPLPGPSAAPQGQGEPVEIRFQPAEGLELKKLFKHSHELNVDGISRYRDAGTPTDLDVTGWVSTDSLIVMRDHYVAVDEGGTASLSRLFQRILHKGKATMSSGGSGQFESKMTGGSPLEGRTVLFNRQAEGAEHARRLEFFDGPEDILAPIREDMDAKGILPDGPVVEGDFWYLDSIDLLELLAPGGDLNIYPLGFSEFSRLVKLGGGGALGDMLTLDSIGSATVVYGGKREVDGVSMGILHLSSISLNSVVDQTDAYRDAMPAEERDRPGLMRQCIFEFSMIGEGEVLWNLEGGYMHSLEIEGQESVGMLVSKEFKDVGAPAYIETERTTLSGKISFDHKFSIAPPHDEDPHHRERPEAKPLDREKVGKLGGK